MKPNQRATVWIGIKVAAAVTLATLPKTVNAFAMEVVQEHLKLQIELHNKILTKDKLSNADFMPRSIHLNFALGASERVKEHHKDQLKTLSDSC